MAEMSPRLETMFHNLVRYQIELWNAIDARLRSELDLSLGQFEGMGVIDSRGRCRVNDIGTDLVITVGGASKLVDRIEANGFCARTSNPDDRRSSFIELTAAGQQALSRARVVFADELTRRLANPLSASALLQLEKTLETLRTATLVKA